ncbi:hypothetical protein SDC9_127177 [bioreactor metagenome]|uniref:Uncharacterized protein n=1 Tax=bioreactor metagenome TaxID=1076179 RepID=A0A645CT91_9ZZZZ
MSDSHAILGAACQLRDDMLSDEVARFGLPIGSVGFRVKGRHLLCDDAERDQCRVIGQVGKLGIQKDQHGNLMSLKMPLWHRGRRCTPHQSCFVASILCRSNPCRCNLVKSAL